ncbi:hypothetical protein ACU8KH_06529 [Lachancea thermotolerans]
MSRTAAHTHRKTAPPLHAEQFAASGPHGRFANYGKWTISGFWAFLGT